MKFKCLNIRIVSIVLLLIGIFASLFIGAYDVSFSSLLDGDATSLQILFASRIPRILAVLCTGAGMSIAGLIMQQLSMNKYVSPTTGATISSAQFGILIALAFVPNSTLIDKALFGFVFSLLGTCIFMFFMNRVKFKDIIMVPLVGIMFGNVIGGVTQFIAYGNGLTQALTSWTTGDFSLIIRGRYEIVFLVVPLLIIAYLFSNHFNIVGMGEGFAKNLGVSYNKVLFLGLAIASMITASIVVTVGSVPYLGLIIPNVMSMIKGDQIKKSFFDIAMFGAIFTVYCDIAGRLINYPYEIPISLTVGVIGTLLFIGIIFKQLKPKKQRSEV